jgi:hypothetical protein
MWELKKMEKTKTQKANSPAEKFRAGNVTATVWKNERKGKNGTFEALTVSIEKSYQDDKEEWQTTNTYAREDLAKLLIVVNEAQKYCYSKHDGQEE